MQQPHPPEPSRVRVDSAGRIVVPSELRQRLGIHPGSELIVSADDRGVHLHTLAQTIRAVQAALAPYRTGDSIVDELIRDRRAEARKEPGKRPRDA